MPNISDSDAQRINVARAEARNLGYLLMIEEALNVAPHTHMALAGPYLGDMQVSHGRFLAYGTSAAEAAEAGLDVLDGIVNRGDPWPD
jgi:hypothetical protein